MQLQEQIAIAQQIENWIQIEDFKDRGDYLALRYAGDEDSEVVAPVAVFESDVFAFNANGLLSDVNAEQSDEDPVLLVVGQLYDDGKMIFVVLDENEYPLLLNPFLNELPEFLKRSSVTATVEVVDGRIEEAMRWLSEEGMRKIIDYEVASLRQQSKE